MYRSFGISGCILSDKNSKYSLKLKIAHLLVCISVTVFWSPAFWFLKSPGAPLFINYLWSFLLFGAARPLLACCEANLPLMHSP